MSTARTRLVAVALCKTSSRLVLEVRLSGGGATPADNDPRQHDDDHHRQTADGQ